MHPEAADAELPVDEPGAAVRDQERITDVRVAVHDRGPRECALVVLQYSGQPRELRPQVRRRCTISRLNWVVSS